MRRFTAHVLTREGTWAHKQLRGPATFEQWEASWDVFAAAMVMLGIAAPGVFRQYAAGIKRLDRLFPRDWPTIAALDEEMRCEQWGRLRQEIVDGDENMPAGWKAESPWASIISATRSNFLAGPRADWWREREMLLERALKSKPSVGPRSGVLPPALPSVQGTPVIPEKAGSSGDVRGLAAPGSGQSNREENKAKPKKNRGNKKKGKAEQSGKGGGKAGQVGPCHTCGKMGHLKRDCPKNNQQAQGSKEEGGGKRRKKQSKKQPSTK